MSGPPRQLSAGLATFLVAGNMIGSGIYLLPASLGAFGAIGLLGWLGALAAALVYAAMFAWFATARTGASGFLGSIEAAFGANVAFAAGALYWLQALLGNVAIALAVTGYLGAIFPLFATGPGSVGLTIAVIWLFVLLNIAGPRLIARIEGATLLIGLLPVLVAGTLGWLYFDPGLFAANWNVSGAPAAQVVPQAIVLVLWAFLGLESACVASELVENPKRNVPVATLGGVLLAAIIYVSASTALSGILPAAALASSTAPFADATTRILGASLGVAIAICAAIKASGTLGGWILLTAEAERLVRAVDRPAAHVNRAIARPFLTSGILMTIVAAATADPSIGAQFARLANAVVVLMICVYAVVGAAMVRLLRRGEADLPRWAGLLGWASILVSAAIMAAQDGYTLCALAVTLAIIAIVRLALLRRAPG